MFGNIVLTQSLILFQTKSKKIILFLDLQRMKCGPKNTRIIVNIDNFIKKLKKLSSFDM